jgi:hypothetical protein
MKILHFGHFSSILFALKILASLKQTNHNHPTNLFEILRKPAHMSHGNFVQFDIVYLACKIAISTELIKKYQEQNADKFFLSSEQKISGFLEIHGQSLSVFSWIFQSNRSECI